MRRINKLLLMPVHVLVKCIGDGRVSGQLCKPQTETVRSAHLVSEGFHTVGSAMGRVSGP